MSTWMTNYFVACMDWNESNFFFDNAQRTTETEDTRHSPLAMKIPWNSDAIGQCNTKPMTKETCRHWTRVTTLKCKIAIFLRRNMCAQLTNWDKSCFLRFVLPLAWASPDIFTDFPKLISMNYQSIKISKCLHCTTNLWCDCRWAKILG